jgi:hypothetical protein
LGGCFSSREVVVLLFCWLLGGLDIWWDGRSGG